MQETRVWSLGGEDPLEEAMETNTSIILAWRIPWTEEPGRLQSIGSQGTGHDRSDLAAAAAEQLSTHACIHMGSFAVQQRILTFLVLLSVLLTQSYLTLCNPMKWDPPGFSVHGIFQARIPDWVSIPFSRSLCLAPLSTWWCLWIPSQNNIFKCIK